MLLCFSGVFSHRMLALDKLNQEQRSRNMSAVRQKDTKPEIEVRKMLHSMGYRFRLHRKDLPGTPDIYLKRFRTAVFVHGCFWHGHTGCARGKLPATRRDFWKAKQDANRRRDHMNEAQLEAQGIRVLTVWECELKDKEALTARLQGIRDHV